MTETDPNKTDPQVVQKNSAELSTDTIPKGEKMLAMLGYVSFLCVLPLAVKPNSAFCQYHGKQGLVLALIFFLAFSIFGAFSVGMNGLLKFLYLAVIIYAAIQVNLGKKFALPMVSEIVGKLKW